MSNMSRAVKPARAGNAQQAMHDNRVENFMGGGSFRLDPLETLKLVTASSIFGEPQYYRDGEFASGRVTDGVYGTNALFGKYSVLPDDGLDGMKTSAVMERVIDDALAFDFGGTVDWAMRLRSEFNMRLNPQVIMVRAAVHPGRAAYTQAHPGGFAQANQAAMSRADDVISQLTYYLYVNKDKKSIPGILKRSWAKRVESLDRYELAKYKSAGIGMIDTIRICHAHGEDIDELMRTGTLAMPTEGRTWNSLRSGGMSWNEILRTIRMPHMALLRNLRGIFHEIGDAGRCDEIMSYLIDGVAGGRQFPFRYMSAYDAISSDDGVMCVRRVLDGLERCMDAACGNLPSLAGRSAFLSDNSGSAWGSCTSEYGSVRIAEIDNLSAVIGAANSSEGWVFPFGDDLLEYEISKREGILSQARAISGTAESAVGCSTENGVWLFFEKAIGDVVKWDNIFIYSDQQAGHGGLYGTDACAARYARAGFGCRPGRYTGIDRDYIDVVKLVDAYRRRVNPKVNVFCVQTAGYDNVLVPENGYRTSILYGWTGRELVYADAVNRFWDEFDRNHGL